MLTPYADMVSKTSFKKEVKLPPLPVTGNFHDFLLKTPLSTFIHLQYASHLQHHVGLFTSFISVFGPFYLLPLCLYNIYIYIYFCGICHCLYCCFLPFILSFLTTYHNSLHNSGMCHSRTRGSCAGDIEV